VTERTVDVVTSYLLESGWHQKSEGPVGSLWQKGRAETVLPRTLDVGSGLWFSIVAALANASGEPVDEVATRLEERHREALEGRARRVVAPSTSERVELELHLTGPSVQVHETSAYEFGRLVMRAAESVKELIKSSRGTRHESRNLRVVGGPAEGSVQLLLREPDNSEAESLFPDSMETAEGQALGYLSTVLSAAESASEGLDAAGSLEAHLAPLSVGARAGLARLAEVIMDGGWTVDGAIRRRGEEAPVHLSLSGAFALQRTARDNLERSRQLSEIATFDTWSWSRSELELITERAGTIRVAVPMSLQDEAAHLVAEQQTRVPVRLEVYERVTPDSGQTMRTSYLLIDIGDSVESLLDI